jgi:hypothetical protein
VQAPSPAQATASTTISSTRALWWADLSFEFFRELPFAPPVVQFILIFHPVIWNPFRSHTNAAHSAPALHPVIDFRP